MQNEAISFLKTIYSNCETGLINFRFLPDGKNEFLSVNEMVKTPQIISKYNGVDVYFGVALRRSNDGTKQGISLIPAVWLEHDNFNSNTKEKINSFHQPSIEIQSSRPEKIHLYWLLKEPADHKEISLIEDINRRLASYFNGDSNACDASRILRLPGTLNHKYSPPLPCKIISIHPERQYNRQDFEILPKIDTSKSTDQKQNQSSCDVSTPPRGVKVCYWKALKEGVEEKNPGRHVWALRISKHLQKDLGFSPDIAKSNLIQWNQKNRPPLSEKELNVDRTIADGKKYDWGCNDPVLKNLCTPECKYYKSKDQGTEKDRGLPKDLFQIIDEPQTEETPLIENLLYPGDKGFVVSTYKLGKTLFLMQMTLCLSMAVPFLGLNIPEAKRVLYLRFELKDSRFRKRLNMMLPALGGKDKVQIKPFFHLIRGFDIKNEKDFFWLINLIYKLEPDVLFLDPLYKLSLGMNLRDSESTNPIIRKFEILRDRFPALHISIAHHPRKQSGVVKDDFWDSSYGPMQLFADMDFEIKLTRKGNQKDTFVFSHISNDVPIEDFTFTRNPNSLIYELETKGDIQNRWLQDCDKIFNQVKNGMNEKGNLKTWMQINLKYSQRDAKDCLDFLLNEKKLIWVGTSKRGHLEGPEPKEEDSNNIENHEGELFS